MAGLPRAAALAGTALFMAAALLLPQVGHAQSLTLDIGAAGQSGATSRLVQLTALVTVLSLAPSLLVMSTAFTRIVIVLSLLRGAIGAQGTPPNTVLIGLSLFLTFFVMQPTLEEAWQNGVVPMSAGQLTEMEGLQRTAEPFHRFMSANVRGADLQLFNDLGAIAPPDNASQAAWRALIPAFMIGELRRAFEMGFLIYLPFLVIDLVVGSVLMSLGMMMLPPSAVSLPFKLIFFVMIDGWRLISGSLVQGFVSS
jgi:flagellar biosynthetic protein FliP